MSEIFLLGHKIIYRAAVTRLLTFEMDYFIVLEDYDFVDPLWWRASKVRSQTFQDVSILSYKRRKIVFSIYFSTVTTNWYY